LAGAQQIYNKLSSLNNGNGPLRIQTPALESDFAAVGTALQAGDVSGARQAFSKLQQDVQDTPQAGGTPQTGGGTVNPDVILRISPAGAAAPAAISAPSTASTSPSGTAAPITSAVAPITSTVGSTAGSTAAISTTPAAATATPEIVLNLNASAAQQLGISVSNSSSGEQVTLNVGNGTSSTEQIQLNLAQNQALEINLIA